MKILDNKVCKLGGGIHQFEAFEKLNFTSNELKNLPLPSAIAVVPGYTGSKKVCYHPNLPSLLASMICSSPSMFGNFVKEYCAEFNYSCKLLDLVDSSDFTKVLISSNDLELSDRLLSFLGDHREKLREFVSLLRINRPVSLDKVLDNSFNILDTVSKYYISCFTVEDLDYADVMLTVLGDMSYTGAFNLDIGLSDIEGYEKILEEHYRSVDIYSLDLAVSNCFNDVSNLVRTGKVSSNSYYSERFLKSSIMYDLVYMTLNKSWRI